MSKNFELSEFSQLISVDTANDITLAAGVGINANGTLGTAGQALTTNGTGVYWSTIVGTNTAAQYTWTNTHTFTANVTIGNSSVYPHIISNFGYSNPNTFGVGTLTTNASLNTVLVGPYTIASGNSLVITSGSRVVVI